MRFPTRDVLQDIDGVLEQVRTLIENRMRALELTRQR